ncbi:MAG TPA: class I SAM-dependent RNA methyltransferase [bacterium]|nr:class I SAM-dependent RNA methyltransferase [bacterium]
MPEPGTRLDVTIERAAALGRGVARVDGLTLLVARGVPGEAVTVEVERAFPRYALARVTAVHRAALARTEPSCPHFERCGGCDWQHVDYPAQLAIKRAVVAEQLERIGGGLTPPADWPLVPASEPLGYRDKLEFTPVAHEGRYAPGFHDTGGQTVVPIAQCRLAPEVFTRLAQTVLDALLQAGVLPPPGGHASLPLQRLTVQSTEGRDGAPGLAVLLHLRAAGGRSEGQQRRAWQQAGQAVVPGLRADFPELTAFALQFPARMGRGGQRRSGPSVAVLLGPNWLIKRVAGRAYRVPHTAFFQVNRELAGTLVAHVVEQVQGGPGVAEPAEGPVYDLYGGVGLFALPLAERGRRVVGVDSDREGLRAAEESARGLGLVGCTFLRADLERTGALARLIAQHGPPAAVVCDPPRRGLAAPLREALLAAEPPLIVYVSCDGGTFARDAAQLASAYDLVGLRGFDLFPQTHHVELVGTFRRKVADSQASAD